MTGFDPIPEQTRVVKRPGRGFELDWCCDLVWSPVGTSRSFRFCWPFSSVGGIGTFRDITPMPDAVCGMTRLAECSTSTASASPPASRPSGPGLAGGPGPGDASGCCSSIRCRFASGRNHGTPASVRDAGDGPRPSGTESDRSLRPSTCLSEPDNRRPADSRGTTPDPLRAHT